MLKFVTIDVECDGTNATKNQQLFPESPHWDVNSIPWCCTITQPISERWNDYQSVTYVCKLPPKPRYIGTLNGNKVFGNFHKVDSIVPETLLVNGKTKHIVNCKDMEEFITKLYELLRWDYSGWPIYSKSYGKWNWDNFILNETIKKFVIGCVFPTITNYLPGTWESTTPQVKPGTYIPNQQYMINGIKHNIEDSEQLFLKVLNME